MFGRLFLAALFLAAATKADALEIIESNFQHIDPRLGKQLLADSVAPGVLLSPISEDWLELSSLTARSTHPGIETGDIWLHPVLGGSGAGLFCVSTSRFA
jgi:hypothetical protein